MEKYSIMLYPYKHKTKKQAQKYVGAIKTGILNYPQKMTIAQIAEAVTTGHTVIFGCAKYHPADIAFMNETQKTVGASAKHWKNQQIFAVDFDNEKILNNKAIKLTGDKYFSINKALEYCKSAKIPPAFLYTTDSHKKNHHRFRLVFVLDKIIDTIDNHRNVTNSLFNMFTVNDECVVDTKCCDPCRLFYPGKELIYKDYAAVVNTNYLIEKFNTLTLTAESVNVSSKKIAVNQKNLSCSTLNIVKLIKTTNINELIKIVVSKLQASETSVSPELECYQLWREQVSYIYNIYNNTSLYNSISLTKDSCSPQSLGPVKPITIRHPDDYYEITRKFPLNLFLDIPKYTNFNCILSSHTDSKPSARIEQTKNGDYIYHCYGCDSYLDIFNVVEQIANCSHLQAKSFINKLLNIKFETDWQIEKKAEITEYQDYIWGNQFKLSHEWLQKRLANKGANALGILNMVLQLARLYIYDRKVTGDENPLFYMSLSLMAEKAKNFGQISSSKTVIHKKLKLLSRLGLIKIVKETDLPIKFKHELQARKIKNNQHYRINCFSIPRFTMALLDSAEERLRKIEQTGMRRKYYCREAELRANGITSANEQYVQNENKLRSVKTDEFYEKYKKTAIALLTKGWTTEKEILSKLRGYTSSYKQELSGVCLPQLLQELNLKRTPYSKLYETKFAIKKGTLTYGVSKIIMNAL